METKTRYAEIPKIKKGIAFSDPSYDGTVWCQYRKEFEASGWLMKLETNRDADNYVNFTLSLGRRSFLSGLLVKEDNQDLSISNYAHYETANTELGMDTAQIFVGSLENFENFGEEASIYTASDGFFGDMIAFTAKGEQEPAGFLLIGVVDGGITDEKDLFQTLVASFDGRPIVQARYEELTNKQDIEIRIMLAKETAQGKKDKDIGKAYKDQPER